jgi:hypothetical protein
LDDHSRYLLVLQAVWSAHGELVREQLETAFASCGVPDAILKDHGIPWWSARGTDGRDAIDGMADDTIPILRAGSIPRVPGTNCKAVMGLDSF